jgi:hypothetical protein
VVVVAPLICTPVPTEGQVDVIRAGEYGKRKTIVILPLRVLLQQPRTQGDSSNGRLASTTLSRW